MVLRGKFCRAIVGDLNDTGGGAAGGCINGWLEMLKLRSNIEVQRIWVVTNNKVVPSIAVIFLLTLRIRIDLICAIEWIISILKQRLQVCILVDIGASLLYIECKLLAIRNYCYL